MVVKAKPEEKQDPAIVSAKQTGVKAVTVETNFDANNSKISLMKGSSVVEEKHTISEDGKTITFATTASLVAAQYTVKVDELSMDLQAEASKTAKIEFLSDKAAVTDKDNNGAYQAATVGYRVLNQFDDDITKSVSLTANGSCTPTLKPSEHLIKFNAPTGSNGFMIGRDIITVSLLDTASSINATATLTVSSEAYASELTYEGVYNTDNKTLTEDTDLGNDTFYVLFSAKDQYGNKYKSYKNVVDSDDLYLTVIGGLTGLTRADHSDHPNFIVLNKDGVDYLAYPLAWSDSMTHTAGTATVQLLSTGGATCSGEITIAEGGRVASITVSQNGVVVAGEENELAYTALDASGKEVTSYKYLRQIVISGSQNEFYHLAFERNTDGTAKLVLDASNATVGKNEKPMLSYSFKTLNNKFSNVLITVSENARPVAINGLRDVDTTISNNTKYVDIKVKNLVIEDQYGRILGDGTVAGMTGKSGEYKLAAVSASAINSGDVLQVSGAAIGVEPATGWGTNAKITFNSAVGKNDVLFSIKPKTLSTKGTQVITFTIANAASGDKALADASVDVNFTVKDTSAVTTATAKVDSVYALNTASGEEETDSSFITKAKAYAQKVEVKANGALLSSKDYTVEAPKGLEVVEDKTGATDVWTVYCKVDRDNFDTQFSNKTATTVTRTLTITLNGTGEKFTTDVVVDTTAPKITTVSDFTGKINPATNAAIKANSLFGGVNKLVGYTSITDQYGKAVTDMGNGSFKFKDDTVVDATYNFVCTVPYGEGTGAPYSLKNNNTKGAEMKTGDHFAGATLTINFGGTTKDVKVLPTD